MKRLLKSTLVAFLVVSMVFSTFGVFAANLAMEEADKVSVGEYHLDFVNKLGIVEFNPSSINDFITNENFAAVAGILGGFTDDYYDDGILDIMVNSGYMLNTNKYPDRPITYIQALKAIVSVLGYDLHAKSLGKYPQGYNAQAEKLGLTDGLSKNNDDNITFGEAAVLIYNALTVRPLSPKTYGSSKLEFQKGDTVLSDILDIKSGVGKVTGNSITTTSGQNDYRKGIIEIDSVEFDTDRVIYDNYIGLNVEYWYKSEKGGRLRLLHAEIDDRKNDIVEMNSDDGFSISGNTVKYYDSKDKQKTLTLDPGYIMIYNNCTVAEGQSIQDCLEEIENADSFAVMADTDNDNRYDVVKLSKYTTMFVSKVSGGDYTVYNAYSPNDGHCFNVEDESCNYIFRNADGAYLSFGNIKEKSVISVFRSIDKKYATVIISENSVDATIIAKSDNKYGKTIETEQATYNLSMDNASKIYGQLEIGKTYRLYLDFKGNIAGFDEESETFIAALIIDTDIDDANSFEKKAKIKLFRENGKSAEYEFAKSVKVDGETKKTPEAVIDALYDGSEYHSKLIRFKTNSEGLINFVDTGKFNKGKESEESLRLLTEKDPDAKYKWTKTGYMFSRQENKETNEGKGFKYDPSLTKLFGYMVTDEFDPTDEAGYGMISNINNLNQSNSYFNVEAYAVGMKSIDTKYAVLGMDDASAIYKYYSVVKAFFVENVGKTLVDGEERTVLYGVNLFTGLEDKMIIKDTKIYGTSDLASVNDLKAGDVFSYYSTYDGRISDLNLAHRLSDVTDGDFETGLKLTDYHDIITTNTYHRADSNRWLYGSAYSAQESHMYFLRESMLPVDIEDYSVVQKCEFISMVSRAPYYYIYDTDAQGRAKKLKPASKDDVKDCVEAGDQADKLLVAAVPTYYNAIIIIR